MPVRLEASEAAEMLTQLLFAQTVDILEEQPRWIRVRNDADGQTGWVDFKMLTKLTDEDAEDVASQDRSARVTMPIAYATDQHKTQMIPLTAGTILPDYKDGTFEVLGMKFMIDAHMVAATPLIMNAENLWNNIRYFQNIPYLWGGKNALGMDCSGFTQVIMSLFGRQLLRNASEQATQGTEVTLTDAQAGDLAFFDHEDGRISHVGIVLDTERVIHCSGCVKVEKLDEKGIYSHELGGVYTHHLVQIRRY